MAKPKRGVLLDVEWDRSNWDASFKETTRLLGNMQPIMDLIGMHMEASVKQTLKEGGPPGKLFKRTVDGQLPFTRTGTTIHDRVFFAGATANEARVASGFEFSHVHQFGATITAKQHPYLLFQVAGQWVRKKEVEIPARPFMVFRPEDPEKIAGIASAAIELKFGKGAGAFWGMVS